MLAAVGNTPVNSLSVSGVPDVIDALTILRGTLTDLQAVGWAWNTDRNYSLAPQTDGTIPIPAGALEVDPEDNTANVVVRRNVNTGNMSLYDADSQTFQFSAATPCKIVWAFPYEDIPQAGRAYVAAYAARKFQAQRVSSPTLDAFDDSEQKAAWILLQRAERRARDTNSFRANTASQKALRRRF